VIETTAQAVDTVTMLVAVAVARYLYLSRDLDVGGATAPGIPKSAEFQIPAPQFSIPFLRRTAVVDFRSLAHAYPRTSDEEYQ
jgi:hypothetical protein